MSPYPLLMNMRAAYGDTVSVTVFTWGGTGVPIVRLYRHITSAGLITSVSVRTTMIQLNVLELLIHLCSTLRAHARMFVCVCVYPVYACACVFMRASVCVYV